MMINPIQAAKLAAILAALTFVSWLWLDRGHAHETIRQQAAIIAAHDAQALANAAEADRKANAYAEAKRKADNDAEYLRGRVAWLQKQTPKGCTDAASLIRGYRERRP